MGKSKTPMTTIKYLDGLLTQHNMIMMVMITTVVNILVPSVTGYRSLWFSLKYFNISKSLFS